MWVIFNLKIVASILKLVSKFRMFNKEVMQIQEVFSQYILDCKLFLVCIFVVVLTVTSVGGLINNIEGSAVAPSLMYSLEKHSLQPLASGSCTSGATLSKTSVNRRQFSPAWGRSQSRRDSNDKGPLARTRKGHPGAEKLPLPAPAASQQDNASSRNWLLPSV